MIASYKIYDNIQNTNIFRVYPEKIFCDSFVSNECVGAFSGKLFYYDKSHLTKDGAALVGREIEKIINN